MAYDDEVRQAAYYTRQERFRALVGAVAIFGMWFLLNLLLGDSFIWSGIIGPLLWLLGILRNLFIAIFGQLSYDLD